MVPFRNILVSLDGSALAEKAIAPALKIAETMAARAAGQPVRLVLLRVVGPVALVAQDGAEGGLPVHLGLDAVFIGGSDPWWASEAPYRVVAAARAHGLWVHWGRANSLRAVRRLRAAGVHSADGTYLAHGPDANRPRLEGWMRDGAACAPLAFAAPMPPRSVLRCAGCGVGVMWRHHQAIRWAAHDLALGLADEVAIEAYGEEAGGPGPACWACHQAGERAALRAAELRRADWAA